MVVDTVFADEGETLEEAYTKWRGWAEDQACCDYALKVALPSKIDNTVLSEMETLSSEEYGVNTFCIDMIGHRQVWDHLKRHTTKLLVIICDITLLRFISIRLCYYHTLCQSNDNISNKKK